MEHKDLDFSREIRMSQWSISRGSMTLMSTSAWKRPFHFKAKRGLLTWSFGSSTKLPPLTEKTRFGKSIESWLKIRSNPPDVGIPETHPKGLYPPRSSEVELRKSKKNTEPGELVDEIWVELNDSRYRLERYQSTTINVFNEGSGEYEPSKPLLRRIIAEKNLRISLTNKTGKMKNTRSQGWEVMEVFEKKEDWDIWTFWETEEWWKILFLKPLKSFFPHENFKANSLI